MKDGHSGIQQKSVATVPKFQSSQETVNALERQPKWEDIQYAQEQRSGQTLRMKSKTQHRISTPKKVGHCLQKRCHTGANTDAI